MSAICCEFAIVIYISSGYNEVICLTNILIMQQRGAGSRSCGQEIPEFNGTQTVSTLFRKGPLNSVPGYFNPVHITTIFLLPVLTLSFYMSLRLTDMFLPFHLSLWYIFIHDWSYIHRYACYMSLRSHLP